jgi:hypothetical protein
MIISADFEALMGTKFDYIRKPKENKRSQEFVSLPPSSIPRNYKQQQPTVDIEHKTIYQYARSSYNLRCKRK